MASKTKKDHQYSEEQKKFLKENIGFYTYKELTEEFNKKFGTNQSHGNISDLCLKRLGVKRNKPYVFQKGRKDFSAHPIGKEVFNGQNIWVKVKDDYISEKENINSKQSSPNWRKKHILIYEKHYGIIPNGSVVVFLDQNKKNCEIDNLYLTTRRINFLMVKNKWHKKNRKQTLTAIKWCELYYAMKLLISK